MKFQSRTDRRVTIASAYLAVQQYYSVNDKIPSVYAGHLVYADAPSYSAVGGWAVAG